MRILRFALTGLTRFVTFKFTHMALAWSSTKGISKLLLRRSFFFLIAEHRRCPALVYFREPDFGAFLSIISKGYYQAQHFAA